jgi:peptidoglycan/xylan/chitin deacetylase (PgdA/CDA1 family)
LKKEAGSIGVNLLVLKDNIDRFVRESAFLEPLKWVRRELIRRGHWKRIIKDMKQRIPYLDKPGIAFSFDDSFRVNDWYKYGKELFGYYDVKVTFNINAFHHFEERREHSQEEIDRLIELQSNGHEIAHHGYRHQKAVKYSNENGVGKWIEEDIIALLDWMGKQSHSQTKEKFKKPVSFAYPGSSYNERTTSALVPQYFKIVRGHVFGDHLTLFGHTGFAPSLCIDRNHLTNLNYIKKAMRVAKQTGKNLIFMCHSILPEEINWDDFGWGQGAKEAGEYRISPKMIQAIIREARKNDLAFYTTAEIAGVATFIDPNLERCIREQLQIPAEKWISISELKSVRELDLSNQAICHLGGIEYFLNLEKLNLKDNLVTDPRLLTQLPKLKSLDIENNPIQIAFSIPSLIGLGQLASL